MTTCDLIKAVESQLLNEWGPEVTLTRGQAEQLLEIARQSTKEHSDDPI